MKVWGIKNLGAGFWAGWAFSFSFLSYSHHSVKAKASKKFTEGATDPYQSYWGLWRYLHHAQTSWKFLECSSGEASWRHTRQRLQSPSSQWHQKIVRPDYVHPGRLPQPRSSAWKALSHHRGAGSVTSRKHIGEKIESLNRDHPPAPGKASRDHEGLWVNRVLKIGFLKIELFSVTATHLPQEWNHFRPAATVPGCIFWGPWRAHWE